MCRFCLWKIKHLQQKPKCVSPVVELSSIFSLLSEYSLFWMKCWSTTFQAFVITAYFYFPVSWSALRIDSEVSEIHQNLKRVEHQELSIDSDESSLDATSDAALEVRLFGSYPIWCDIIIWHIIIKLKKIYLNEPLSKCSIDTNIRTWHGNLINIPKTLKTTTWKHLKSIHEYILWTKACFMQEYVQNPKIFNN